MWYEKAFRYVPLIVLSCVLGACVERRRDTDASARNTERSQAELDETMLFVGRLRLLERGMDKAAVEIKAHEGVYFQDANRMQFKGPTMYYRTPKGEVFFLSGNESTVWSGGEKLLMKGGVRAVGEDGYKLSTEQLEYQRSAGLLYSPSRTKLDGRGMYFEGNAMRVFPEQSILYLIGNVRGSFQSAAFDPKGSGEKAVISADGLYGVWNERRLAFSGGVSLRQGALDLRSQELLVELDAAKESAKIKRVLAKGAVEAVMDDKAFSSDELSLDHEHGLALLSGHPLFKDQGRSVSGESIRYYWREDRVEVSKGKVNAKRGTGEQ